MKDYVWKPGTTTVRILPPCDHEMFRFEHFVQDEVHTAFKLDICGICKPYGEQPKKFYRPNAPWRW